MKAFGTILSIVGWLLIVAGFVTPMFGTAFPSLIPGFVLMFAGRVVNRTQKAKSDPIESALPPARPVRRSPAPPDPLPPPAPQAPPVETSPELAAARDLQEMIEADERPIIDPDFLSDLEQGPRLSSSEMVARAKRRWDRKP